MQEFGNLRSAVFALLGAGAWAAIAPFTADAVGLRLGVTVDQEVADHVVPGLLAMACATGCLAQGAREPGRFGAVRLVLACIALLAGLWITSTHLALAADALDGRVEAGAALIHCSAGPLVLAAAVWLLAREHRAG